MTDYQIVRARPGDEQTLAFIQTESWKSAFRGILSDEELIRCTNLEKSTAMYKRLLEQQIGYGYILKVRDKPHCIAWWNATREKDLPPGWAELICIHSLPGNWRKGYGAKMMDAVLRDMAAAGYKNVMLWVFEANDRARKFYEAMGFTTQGKAKPGITPTEICYERSLTEQTVFYATDDLKDADIFLRLEKTCEAQPEKRWVPTYYFDICLPDGTKIGHCDLRIGHNDKTYIGGNIGYGIDEPYRGHRYAAKACKLLFCQARKHGMEYVIITCVPENIASSRTCQLAGGRYIETADIPQDNEMYAEGKRQVMIYRFDLFQ